VGSSIACLKLVVHDSSTVVPTAAIASDSAWLTATPAGGTTPFTTNVCVNTSGLAAGTYSGHLTVTMPDQLGWHWTNQPLTVNVKLTLSGAAVPSATETCTGAPPKIVCTITTKNIPANAPYTNTTVIDGITVHVP